jgi:hypothetical protein
MIIRKGEKKKTMEMNQCQYGTFGSFASTDDGKFNVGHFSGPVRWVPNQHGADG